MVQMYTIAGKQVGSHVLAMATLGTTAAIAFFSMGGSKPAETQPPINAKSKDEENFIKDFVKKKAEEVKKH